MEDAGEKGSDGGAVSRGRASDGTVGATGGATGTAGMNAGLAKGTTLAGTGGVGPVGISRMIASSHNSF